MLKKLAEHEIQKSDEGTGSKRRRNGEAEVQRDKSGNALQQQQAVSSSSSSSGSSSQQQSNSGIVAGSTNPARDAEMSTTAATTKRNREGPEEPKDPKVSRSEDSQRPKGTPQRTGGIGGDPRGMKSSRNEGPQEAPSSKVMRTEGESRGELTRDIDMQQPFVNQEGKMVDSVDLMEWQDEWQDEKERLWESMDARRMQEEGISGM